MFYIIQKSMACVGHGLLEFARGCQWMIGNCYTTFIGCFFKGPFYWIYNLPEPKDGVTVLNTLEQIPPETRFDTLIYYPNMPSEVREVLQHVAAHQSWAEQDLKILRAAYQSEPISRKDVVQLLDVWAQSRTLGERYLKALRAYCKVFFEEEEIRIRPALQAATDRAKNLAEQLDLPALLEEISEGFHFAELPRVSEFGTCSLLLDYALWWLICKLRRRKCCLYLGDVLLMLHWFLVRLSPMLCSDP